MSWDDYVNKSLVGTGSVDKAAIYGIDGLGLWAGTSGFTASSAEIAAIAKAYDDKSEPKQVQSEGFHISGVKYVVIKAEDRSIYGMKGKEGIVIVKSKQTIIVAHYSPPVQAPQAATVVESLADYLIGAGY